MRTLIFGDIYGRIGRKALAKELPILREKYKPDFVIVNIENCTSGRGPITEHAQYISSLGVDIMTGGDHIFDNAENIISYFSQSNCNLIRPANFYETKDLMGKGSIIIEKGGKRLLVIQLLGEVFMNLNVENPFLKIDSILAQYPRESYDVAILDFHRETTAEMYGMAYHLEGRIGLVYGTHTHIQTNDAHILSGGTGMITDVGMNGPKDSVIGAHFPSVHKRFLSGIPKGKIQQEVHGDYLIGALYAEFDEKSGICTFIENISYIGK